ncbi:MAG TPA: hypothetical protein EYH31_02115 [Anaerolineae bacterium]|nr:hypothetical protein [Anaerolineae bacterium]
MLSQIFYRISCPSAEALGDYAMNHLPPGKRLEVALHLRHCPYCRRELALFAPDEETEGWLGRLAAVIQRVRWGTLAPARLPAPVRGPVRRYAATAEDIQVRVEVQPARSGYQRWRLLGQIEPALAASTAELWQEDQVVATAPVDEMGYFSFDRLSSGNYRFRFYDDSTETWVDEVTVP